MSADPSPQARSELVARLRAAGCVFAEDEARLLIAAARTPADLAAMVDRRAAGLPLEQVVGWAEFCGLRIAVDARRVRAPPPHRVPGPPGDRAGPPVGGASLRGPACRRGPVLRLGRGGRRAGRGPGTRPSCTPPTSTRPRWPAPAATSPRPAVTCTRATSTRRCPPRCAAGSALLTANVPYIPTGQIGLLPAEARLHEPRVALDGGADGLDVLRRVAAAAPEWLAPGGHLLTETERAPGAAGRRDRGRGRAGPAGGPSDELSATVVIGTPSASVARADARARPGGQVVRRPAKPRG